MRIWDPGSVFNFYRLSYRYSKIVWHSVHFWGEVRGSNRIVLILLIRIFPSDQKHSTRNCIKFADVIFLVLNVDSRGENESLYTLWHRIKEFYTNEVEFREITLNTRSPIPNTRGLIQQQNLECDFTKFDLICVEFLDSVSDHVGYLFYFAAIDIETEISLGLQTLYNSWSNAFDLKEKVELEVSKRLSYFRDLSKKLPQKSNIFTVGKPIEIDRRSRILRSSLWETLQRVRICDFWVNFFSRFEEVISSFWYF